MKYKKFFGIPLYRLPFRLPKRKVVEKKIEGKELGKKLQMQGNLQGYNVEELIKILMLYTTSRNRRPMRIVFITNKINVGRVYLSSVYESFDDLDSVYGNLASEIPIKTERKKGLSLPVVGYGYENFDPAEHDASKINFKRIVADSASPFKEKLGNINFQVPMHYYRVPIPCSNAKSSFPDICLIIDTSGSMRGGGDCSLIPWGDKSGYHHALLGLYGIIKYLESEGIAPSLLWNVINFSNSTNASGWKTYSEMRELKKHALTPQFGGTEIDVNVLNRELGKEPSLVTILSDGRIYNWDRIKNDVRDIVEKNYTSFIQIGEKTQVGKDMQEYGAAVHMVKNKEDLSELLIDLTKEIRKYF